MAMQALVLGFGGTGAHVLTALKELTVLKHGRVPETIKLLLFDTIADWKPGQVQTVGGASEERTAKSDDEAASLSPVTEYFPLVDYPPDLRTHVFDYLSPAGDPDAYPHLKDWLHAPWLSENVPPNQLAINIGAAQQRHIGRYAMFKNAEPIVAHLRPIIRRLSDLAKGSDVNVWLVGSSAGGTGAGCLIDAAYLTRLAGDNLKLKVTGLIVLPNVYDNIFGISQGRAYSLLRELERVQEQGVPQDERYVDRTRRSLVSSRVVYDKEGQQVALVQSRLFDDLFYLGSSCTEEEQRKKFFTSVASAIDPYLDANSGPKLLERAVNANAAASSFGAARVYVPTETFTEMFAWEQVAEYLRRLAAPKEVGDHVERLFAGSDQDRKDRAEHKFRNLLELFKQLLDLDSKGDTAKEKFAKTELDARQIVTLWYGLTGGNRTPEEQRMLLSYAEPCYSLTETERPEDSKDWEAKTYKENLAANGVKEKQEESRTRFADKLEEIKRRYTNPGGGERTFDKGRRHVLDTISARLQKKVDDLFIAELAQRRSEFAQSEAAPDQGTVLTQLFAEVTAMLSDQGPLRTAHQVIGKFIAAVASEESTREDLYTRSLQALRDSKKSGMLDFGAWVETYQQEARDECSAYLTWYQKQGLLKDMQQLVLNVDNRLRQWERLLGQLFDALVRREGRGEGEASALFTVTQLHLKGTLEERLYRAARNRSALISFGEQPDPKMHGYQEELRSQSASGLAAKLLSNSHWEASLTPDGVPTLVLKIELPEFARHDYTARDIRTLPQSLYQYFYRPINERLSNTDVFDYLIWLRENRDIEPETVIRVLNSEANTLISAGQVPETRTLIYSDPKGGSKKDLADSLALRLGSPEAVERGYSDRNAIVLMKIKKPSLNQIADIQDCQRDYFMLRSDEENDSEAHDKALRRALVFHPFRQEMEAWYIERFSLNQQGSNGVPTLSPRIARLLEEPEMMRLFVQSIATKTVEPSPAGWVWHGPNGDVLLTDAEDDPSAHVIKAAVTFALKQGEGRKDGRRPITRDAARQSITKKVQDLRLDKEVLIKDFVKNELDNFLIDHAPENLREALKIVFTFYCDPNTRTALHLRVNLP